ncbi:MAG: AMP-binding protein [Crocinitomicaceae bacterium]
MDLRFHTDNKAFQASIHSFVKEWNDDLPYFEVNTSGSTGKPKTIQIQKEYALASARMTGAYLNLCEGMHALLCLSPETIAGKMMLVRAMELNLTLHIVNPSSQPFDGLTAPIDFVALVPYQMQQTLEHQSSVFHQDMRVIIGGGPVSQKLEKEIQSLPAQCFHTFGMTETITHIALRDLTNGKKSFALLDGVTAEENDGRLVISAPHLGIHCLSTNDCVTMEGDRAFQWLGRMDFVINSGGIKIHPEIVDEKLASILDVPYFTIGVEDEKLGQKMVLCVESQPFLLSKSSLENLLPKYHLPKDIYFYDHFQYTKSDKINRLATIANPDRHEAPIL